MSHRKPRFRRRTLSATGALMLLASGGAVATTAEAAVSPAAGTPHSLSAGAAGSSLAVTPPMGWNPWTRYRCSDSMNEKTVKANVDIIVARGLKAAGYEYVNLDDCWAAQERDAEGRLQPNLVRFPGGIKALADYVHSKGLKFGVYSSASVATCQGVGPGKKGFPGSLGHEETDADTWYSWGVDYLKYDSCGGGASTPADPDNNARYQAMSDALRKAGERHGRQIVYSICNPTGRSALWAPKMSNLWRTTGDIGNFYSSMLANFHENSAFPASASPGHWNDPDMLLTGNRVTNDAARPGLTPVEERTQMSLWAMMAAPLVISTDLPARDAEEKAGLGKGTFDVLTNKDVVAVDQDPLGKQGKIVQQTVLASSPKRLDNRWATVMSKELSDGSRAVTLTNESDTERAMGTTALQVGLRGANNYTLVDLWTKTVTIKTGSYFNFTVPAHGTIMIKVIPTN
ncbi:glycoside hydrolase family 27 protein [Streptomyces sp. CA-243310]|uniref:glycoside hydrolase family 27 protein n=1 Tax=Streptomyces sp. CA-243310 TaxID=3240056 RepID=UPI003D91707B